MTITKSTALFIVLLNTSALVTQSPSTPIEPYGFQDIHLGMSIAEFTTVHPAPKIEKNIPRVSLLPGQALCVRGILGPPRDGIMRCHYDESYLNIRLRVSTIFVNETLALIEIQPPPDSPSCFEPPPPAGTDLYFYKASCLQYPHLLQDLTGMLGPAIPIFSKDENKKSLQVLRWENDSSLAEFQYHMCGPWDATDSGWAKAISELLEGSYCGSVDSLGYQQPIMLYLHKELSRTLVMRLAE